MSDLYREEILDHYEHPRHAGKLENPDISFATANKTCGDKVSVDIIFGPDNVVKDIAFTASGCALTIAGASLLSEKVLGKTTVEICALRETDMTIFTDVPAGSARIPCIMLGLATLQKALQQLRT